MGPIVFAFLMTMGFIVLYFSSMNQLEKERKANPAIPKGAAGKVAAVVVHPDGSDVRHLIVLALRVSESQRFVAYAVTDEHVVVGDRVVAYEKGKVGLGV